MLALEKRRERGRRLRLAAPRRESDQALKFERARGRIDGE
jgi:hypothetical protein